MSPFQNQGRSFFALTDKLFNDIEPFAKIKGRTDINGLEKIKLTLQIINENEEYAVLQLQLLPLIKSSPTAFKVLWKNGDPFSIKIR